MSETKLSYEEKGSRFTNGFNKSKKSCNNTKGVKTINIGNYFSLQICMPILTFAGWQRCCQMAKFDPFLSLDCARVEGVGAQSEERKGSNFAA